MTVTATDMSDAEEILKAGTAAALDAAQCNVLLLEQRAVSTSERVVSTDCPVCSRHRVRPSVRRWLSRQKHTPKRSPSPLIPDILLAYASEHLPGKPSGKNASYAIADLSAWWGDKTLNDITARACRKYAS